jgi:hypothetical protein
MSVLDLNGGFSRSIQRRFTTWALSTSVAGIVVCLLAFVVTRNRYHDVIGRLAWTCVTFGTLLLFSISSFYNNTKFFVGQQRSFTTSTIFAGIIFGLLVGISIYHIFSTTDSTTNQGLSLPLRMTIPLSFTVAVLFQDKVTSGRSYNLILPPARPNIVQSYRGILQSALATAIKSSAFIGVAVVVGMHLADSLDNYFIPGGIFHAMKSAVYLLLRLDTPDTTSSAGKHASTSSYVTSIWTSLQKLPILHWVLRELVPKMMKMTDTSHNMKTDEFQQRFPSSPIVTANGRRDHATVGISSLTAAECLTELVYASVLAVLLSWLLEVFHNLMLLFVTYPLDYAKLQQQLIVYQRSNGSGSDSVLNREDALYRAAASNRRGSDAAQSGRSSGNAIYRGSERGSERGRSAHSTALNQPSVLFSSGNGGSCGADVQVGGGDYSAIDPNALLADALSVGMR